MKRIIVCILAVVFLCGCRNNDDIGPATALRKELQNAAGCSFEAVVTADYGETVYTFVMDCVVDETGQLQFEVTEPDTISGITGTISGDEGALTFDEQVLAFDTMADGYISPVLSPWVMINSLKSGYITSCGELDNGHRITLNDSYAEDALEMDVWIDQEGKPVHCEILYKERRCLTIVVENFEFV